ncbi:hypothetical protein G8A07_10740 [Roseateles sp. DAIF2]|uniref:hypothetical protein n=1 Tax=Roseateles sp. DAIF2 TaxID=2714952 RepID=UPI0018A29A70|nr:hypothetical protein [Roseateles sp. DAIF2]QPF73346.1 hypothetical protein G8A07_10740 [Roseateles sp. DAIF2]
MDKFDDKPTVSPLGLSADAVLELLLSTPLSIVVRARAEFDDGSVTQEAGLVIARQGGCRGDRPTLAALQAAAWLCAVRLSRCGSAVRRLCRVLIRVDGGWVPVLEWPGALPRPAAA